MGQVYRARIEEQKMLSIFPDYQQYKSQTGMFLPKIYKLKILT
jgi:protein-S-isoprenylcysteine O-methyltransferase Ste14